MTSGVITTTPLILASQSPRRQELLAQAGYTFTVVPPDDNAEDAQRSGESPSDFVQRLAVQKAQNVAAKVKQGIIIACDTVAVCRQEILGKPLDRRDAQRMLTLLSGQNHFVYSGLCVLQAPDSFCAETDITELQMLPISDAELEAYLDGGHWQGKAGAFGYQDGNRWIRIVKGSASNVVGLPMERLRKMLPPV